MIEMYVDSITLSTTDELLAPVREQLTAMEGRLRESLSGQHQALTAATEHLLDSGGKRVRPALALLSAGLFAADRDHAVSLAAAVEMLHTATLVHDDLIDRALLRRGIPTLNAKWSPDATVLTGDYLFARAASFAAQTESVRVMNIFAETLMVIVNGEIRQKFANEATLSREGYFQRIHAKTASMFALAAEAGAVLGATSETAIRSMRRYGRETGMAFQIVDDVLDFIGSADRIGKPVGSDLQQGLLTLPALHYIEANPHDPDVAALLNGHQSDRQVRERLLQSIRASDAIEASLAKARDYVASAKSALSAATAGEHLHTLHAIADYVVEREF
jgi:geranylgeranyl pyrophosphate synthase